MPVRLFKDLEFVEWADKAGLTDDMLRRAAAEIEAGLVDARLGGFLLKKRVAAPGRGKRGSYRTIVAHRQGSRLVFLYGFAKNDRDNITDKERNLLLKLADEYMKYDDAKMSALVKQREVSEIR